MIEPEGHKRNEESLAADLRDVLEVFLTSWATGAADVFRFCLAVDHVSVFSVGRRRSKMVHEGAQAQRMHDIFALLLRRAGMSGPEIEQPRSGFISYRRGDDTFLFLVDHIGSKTWEMRIRPFDLFSRVRAEERAFQLDIENGVDALLRQFVAIYEIYGLKNVKIEARKSEVVVKCIDIDGAEHRELTLPAQTKGAIFKKIRRLAHMSPGANEGDFPIELGEEVGYRVLVSVMGKNELTLELQPLVWDLSKLSMLGL